MVLSFVEKYCFNARMHYDGGASAYASAAVAAASTGAQIGMTGSMNKRAAHETRKTRAWQTSEREASQDWQRKQWEDTNAWNLEQWNRQNEYNSLEAQKERAVAAGFSPLSVLNGAGSDSASLSTSPAGGASAPSASLPQMWNPADNISVGMAAMTDMMRVGLEQKKVENETRRTDAEIQETIARTDKTWAETKTINGLRQGQIDLYGVQIDLGKSQLKVNEETLKKLAAETELTKQKVKESMQAVVESGARVDLISWNKFADAQRLSNEQKELGAKLILMHSSARNIRQQTGLLRQQTRAAVRENRQQDWYSEHFFKKDTESRSSLLESGADYEFNRSSPLRLNLENASAMLQPFGDVFKMYCAGRIGAAMNSSTRNPIGFR